jgi:hypothetical protein
MDKYVFDNFENKRSNLNGLTCKCGIGINLHITKQTDTSVFLYPVLLPERLTII